MKNIPENNDKWINFEQDQPDHAPYFVCGNDTLSYNWNSLTPVGLCKTLGSEHEARTHWQYVQEPVRPEPYVQPEPSQTELDVAAAKAFSTGRFGEFEVGNAYLHVNAQASYLNGLKDARNRIKNTLIALYGDEWSSYCDVRLVRLLET